jgi:serine/threonine-protein kinase RsbW
MNPAALAHLSDAVHREIPSDPDEVRRVQEDIERLLATRPMSERDRFAIRLAVEEALVNAIKHGNQMDRAKKVRIAYQLRDHAFDIHITDEGPGFDPADVPDPTDPENLERPCGRGLMLMRHYMEVAHGPRGNCVHLRKVFPDNGHAGNGHAGNGHAGNGHAS